MTTAADLIQEAFYLSNVKDPQEEIESFEASQGLRMLNAIIEQWSSLQIYIPVYELIPLTTVAGTFQYTINKIITEVLQASYYDSNNVKFDLFIIDLKRQNILNYQLTNVQAHPTNLFIQNDQSTVATAITKVFLYPIPDAVYSVTMYAKTVMSDLTYSGDITTLPSFYFKALKFQLANDLSIEYETVLSPRFEKEYDRLIKELKAANKRDMTVQNRNPLRTFRRYRPWGYYVG